jgi:uncharacterized protein (DUF952 family)
MPDVWAAFPGDAFEATSLADEGFIHCSYEHQIDAVLGRYYSGAASVVILTLDTDRLTSRFVEEPSTGGEIYPHIYGPIDRHAIVQATERKLIGM